MTTIDALAAKIKSLEARVSELEDERNCVSCWPDTATTPMCAGMRNTSISIRTMAS